MRSSCHTSSPVSYGFDPAFRLNLLDFGGVHFLQYVQPICNCEPTEGGGMPTRNVRAESYWLLRDLLERGRLAR